MIHNHELPTPEEVIPHRPPHLWLSGITEVTHGEAACGFWIPDDEHFEGHFEGLPLLPGVKQVEAIAQLGAYALMIEGDEPLLPIFAGIEQATFAHPVRPSQTLDLAVKILDRTRQKFKGRGEALVDGTITCEATILGKVMTKRVALRLLGN